MITPRDFLHVARELVQRTSEAHWRSAVSRAYYAAFHAGRLLLADLGFRVPQADRAHSSGWLRLANCGDPATQSFARDLNALRGRRNQADYDLRLSVVQSTVFGQVQLAARVIQAFEAAAQSPLRAAVSAGVRNYERDVLGDVTYQGR